MTPFALKVMLELQGREVIMFFAGGYGEEPNQTQGKLIQQTDDYFILHARNRQGIINANLVTEVWPVHTLVQEQELAEKRIKEAKHGKHRMEGS